MKEQMFVTGVVGVVPGLRMGQTFREAVVSASKQGPATIYVLASLFDYGASKDAMIPYMEAIPARFVLITEGEYASSDERTCGAWADVTNRVEMVMWGKRIVLAVDPHKFPDDADLLIHAGRRVDSGKSIRAMWCDWQDRFGPKGLNSIYALSVLADQIGAGLVAAEPVDGR
jgi:hypothetical protein